jgi:hypothetical protein
MQSITGASFSITNILGVNKKFRFWPYNFSYNFNKYSETLISIFPFLSDIVIITSEKVELAPEILESLDAQYES